MKDKEVKDWIQEKVAEAQKLHVRVSADQYLYAEVQGGQGMKSREGCKSSIKSRY
jgi:hypothetical protein